MTESAQNSFQSKKVPGAGPRPGASQGDTALTPRDILTILRRHLLLIIIFTVIGILVGGGSWYLLSKYAPKYTARTLIRVFSPVQQDPTQIGGPIVQKEIQYGYRQSIASLIKQQNNLQELAERQAVQETKWFQKLGGTKSERISEAVLALEDDLGANAQRDGDFVILSMTCEDRREAALIVNEMADLFVSSRSVAERGDVSEKLSNLNEQRNRLEQELNAAQQALDEVRNRWGFTDLEQDRGDNQEHVAETKLRQLEVQVDQMELEIEQTKANIENLQRQATGPVKVQVERQVESDPIMIDLGQQLSSQQSYLSSLLTRFGEDHKVVQQVKERIQGIKRERQLRQEAIAEQVRQSNLRNAQDQLAVMTSRLERLEQLREEAASRKRNLDLARAQYRERLAIRDERQEMLNQIKAQIEKYKMLYQDPETPKVQLVGRAPVPLEPSFPKAIIFFPGGTMLGLMLGVGLAFLLEMMNDLVRTPRDIVRYLRIPILCVSPHEDDDTLLGDVDDLYRVVREAPYSMTSECYRQMRTNLKFSEFGKSSRVIFLSSGMPKEGKTSVTVNLGITLAAEEKKVLIVDANFWQPAIHTIFPPEGLQASEEDKKSRKKGQPTMQNLVGLSDILEGDADHTQAIRSTEIDNIDVIDSGKPASNPVELLGSPKLKDLLDAQRENYDYVLVDGPPVLLVSGAKLLAKNVDGTILVFNATSTKRGAALRTISELRELDVSIIGSVLFAARALKGGYYQEQFKIFRKYQNPELAKAK